MSDDLNPVARLSELELREGRHGDAYAFRDVSFSGSIGLKDIGCSYTEVPPGKSACPFHSHRMEEEMFVILEGSGVYRFGERRFDVKAGDVLGAPTGGAEYAHKLTNTGSVPLKYLSVSTKSVTEVCEYPDSGKFEVSSQDAPGGAKRLVFVGREGQGDLDYWDGEDRPD